MKIPPHIRTGDIYLVYDKRIPHIICSHMTSQMTVVTVINLCTGDADFSGGLQYTASYNPSTFTLKGPADEEIRSRLKTYKSDYLGNINNTNAIFKKEAISRFFTHLMKSPLPPIK